MAKTFCLINEKGGVGKTSSCFHLAGAFAASENRVLVIDMDWHLKGWTGYTWNPEYFPDPQAFLDWTDKRDLKVPLNLHPADGVGQHEAAFAEFAQAVGVDPETQNISELGRPIRIAEGQPITDVLKSPPAVAAKAG